MSKTFGQTVPCSRSSAVKSKRRVDYATVDCLLIGSFKHRVSSSQPGYRRNTAAMRSSNKASQRSVEGTSHVTSGVAEREDVVTGQECARRATAMSVAHLAPAAPQASNTAKSPYLILPSTTMQKALQNAMHAIATPVQRTWTHHLHVFRVSWHTTIQALGRYIATQTHAPSTYQSLSGPTVRRRMLTCKQ